MMERTELTLKQRISFPNDFFQDEIREGFLVERKMKCAWAAQMEVLKEIDRICKKYGIQYFADSGTLLGAVRHKGFIPWDDDIDISMLRDDYQKFASIVRKELPEGWVWLELNDSNGNFDELFGRVTNSDIYDSRAERLMQFHGCPYVVGVDIFPIDYVPLVKEEEELWYGISKYLEGLITSIKMFGKNNILESIEPELQKVEEICRVKLKRDETLEIQLRKLLNAMVQLNPGDGVEELELIIFDLCYQDRRFKYKREWYEKSIEVPFENIMIPIPVGYTEVLRVLYGDNYMTPIRGTADHEYPFYKKQDMELERLRNEAKK